MRNETLNMLDTIRDAAASILDITRGATYAAFLADRTIRQATERSVQIMGHALERLQRRDPAAAQRLPHLDAGLTMYRATDGGYDAIDHPAIWRVIETSLPALLAETDRLIAAGEHEPDNEPPRQIALQPIIERHKDAIGAIAREFGVTRLEVFGSACTPDWNPETSDIDFIVHYPDGYDFGPWLKRFAELEERLEALLGRPVDLVMASGIKGGRFEREVSKTRLSICESVQEARTCDGGR